MRKHSRPSSCAPGEGCCVVLNGCKGAKSLYLREPMLQGSYSQVGWCTILKPCCSWALPAHTRHTSGVTTQHC